MPGFRLSSAGVRRLLAAVAAPSLLLTHNALCSRGDERLTNLPAGNWFFVSDYKHIDLLAPTKIAVHDKQPDDQLFQLEPPVLLNKGRFSSEIHVFGTVKPGVEIHQGLIDMYVRNHDDEPWVAVPDYMPLLRMERIPWVMFSSRTAKFGFLPPMKDSCVIKFPIAVGTWTSYFTPAQMLLIARETPDSSPELPGEDWETWKRKLERETEQGGRVLFSVMAYNLFNSSVLATHDKKKKHHHHNHNHNHGHSHGHGHGHGHGQRDVDHGHSGQHHTV